MTRERAWAAASLARLFVSITPLAFIDPDLWHEMATARWMVAHRAVATADPFAFTPTITPVVHHEWGLGLIAWGIGLVGGEPALMLTKALLLTLIGAGAWALARARGGSAAMVTLGAFVATGASLAGFTTIRALVLTLVGVVGTLAALERDRDGRPWVAAWLVGWVVWVNVHGGAIVALFLLGAHAAESLVRTRRVPIAPIAAAALAIPLVTLNPWGPAYLRYLATAPFMDRPQILEWGAIWTAPPFVVLHAAVLALLAVYGFARVGPARATGALPLLATLVAAGQHQRHLPIFAVVWLITVPAWLSATPLAELLAQAWASRVTTPLAGALGAIAAVAFVADAGWRVRWPADTYPVDAVDHLVAQGFSGRVATPFVQGGYTLYKLAPTGGQVSFDGRYEVAYPPAALDDNLALYAALPGWDASLERIGADAVLLPSDGPLAAVLPGSAWSLAYVDDHWAIATRAPGAVVDRRGQPASRGVFP